MRSLLTARWRIVKAVLFLVLAAMASGLRVWQRPTWTTAACVVLVAWACSRAYRFAFCVSERLIVSGE